MKRKLTIVYEGYKIEIKNHEQFTLVELLEIAKTITDFVYKRMKLKENEEFVKEN